MRGYLATMEDKPSPIVHSKGADFHYQGIFEERCMWGFRTRLKASISGIS